MSTGEKVVIGIAAGYVLGIFIYRTKYPNVTLGDAAKWPLQLPAIIAGGVK